MKNSEPKVIVSKGPKGSKVKVKTYTRQNVWKESKPYYKPKPQKRRSSIKLASYDP